MVVNKYKLIQIVYPFLIYIVSIIISPYDIYGDQLYYRQIYLELPNYNLIDGYFVYSQTLSSFEFMHYILIKWASLFINKDIFMSLSNAILIFFIIRYMSKLKVSIAIITIIVFSNYYLFVLFFSAERLKFAVIFLFISLNSLNNIKLMYFFGFLSVLTHIQMFILYMSIFFHKIFISMYNIIATMKFRFSHIILIVIVFIILELLSNQIISKASYYITGNLSFPYKIFIFYFLSLIYAKNKSQLIFLFLPLAIASSVILGNRIAIFAYMIFLYYGLQSNHGKNIGVISTSIYYAIQSYLFIYNIFVYGNGYYH